MAIDPRISLGIQTPSVRSAINIFENAINNAENRNIAKQASIQKMLIAQQDQAAKQKTYDLKAKQVEQGLLLGEQNLALGQQELTSGRDERRLKNIHQTGQLLKPFIKNKDYAGGEKFLLDNIGNIQRRIAGGDKELDINESMEALAQWQSGDIQGVSDRIDAVSDLILNADGMTTGQRDFKSITEGFTPEEIQHARKVQAGIVPKAGISAAERIAQNELTGVVASSQAKIAGQTTQAQENVKTKEQVKRKSKETAQNFVSGAVEKLTNLGGTERAYREAIAALDAGANTGQIYSMLPTFDVDSIVLQNIASIAGFEMAKSGGGIITDADMKFGMKTAIPQNLPPKELKEFLQEKLRTQKAIVDNMKEAVLFLDGTDKTMADWYKQQGKKSSIKKLTDDQLLGSF